MTYPRLTIFASRDWHTLHLSLVIFDHHLISHFFNIIIASHSFQPIHRQVWSIYSQLFTLYSSYHLFNCRRRHQALRIRLPISRCFDDGPYHSGLLHGELALHFLDGPLIRLRRLDASNGRILRSSRQRALALSTFIYFMLRILFRLAFISHIFLHTFRDFIFTISFVLSARLFRRRFLFYNFHHFAAAYDI